MASDDCFKVTAMDVEGHSFESVHGGKLDLNGFGSGYGNGSRREIERNTSFRKREEMMMKVPGWSASRRHNNNNQEKIINRKIY